MSNQILLYLIGITGGLFALIIVGYLIIRSKSGAGDMKKIKQLREGTKQKKYSKEVYIKIYIIFIHLFQYLKGMY